MFKSDRLGFAVIDELPAGVAPEDAPAYRLGNLLSLPNAGKWRGHAFAGMLVDRSALEHPGVDLSRLLNLEAIFPATADELASYERVYGESKQMMENRERQFTELLRQLHKRERAARKNSAKVKLLNDLIREWSDIENQCRMRWSGEFGVLMGKSDEQVRRYHLERASDLRTLGGKEDIYRERLSELGEPLLIAAAGMSLDISPLHDFLKSTSFQWNGRNPKEWEALKWLPALRYSLLHQEKHAASISRRAVEVLWEQGWKSAFAVLTAVAILLATGFIILYFRSRGINLR